MKPSKTKELQSLYPVTIELINKSQIDISSWLKDKKPDFDSFPGLLSSMLMDNNSLPQYIAELARLEHAFHGLKNSPVNPPKDVHSLMLNPTLSLVELSWKGLTLFFNNKVPGEAINPRKGEEIILLWKEPDYHSPKIKKAESEDLLALKIAAEDLSLDELVASTGFPRNRLESLIETAIKTGLLIGSKPLIRRDPMIFQPTPYVDEGYLTSFYFTLQWHITQACDLHCKHCYDRSDRTTLPLQTAIKVLDDLMDFCKKKRVKGQVSFTGGNPLLYPHFKELYREASERGFIISILGNPAPRKQIEELISIQMPDFFQLSLEGLEEHNDDIRGKGHFKRVVRFLEILKELKVYSMVMLTLTSKNMDEIIPLGNYLNDKTDAFFFNRLSMVGEGANLRLPQKEEYQKFLDSYLDACKSNPTLGIKDNLLNLNRIQRGLETFGGCTGFGCGAAFNFLAILADGEVHACRKFPSPLGNIMEQGLKEIYDSNLARRYREGASACRSCHIRPVCGGCMAVSYSHGLDPFKDKDPYCFVDEVISSQT